MNYLVEDFPIFLPGFIKFSLYLRNFFFVFLLLFLIFKYILNGHVLSYLELLLLLLELVQHTNNFFFLASTLGLAVRRPLRSKGACTKLARFLLL